MRRSTIVIHSLHGGGVERITAAMANHWAAVGDKVTLISLDHDRDDRYPLNPNVSRVALDLMSESTGVWEAMYRNVDRIRKLRTAIHESKPDVVVSLLERTNILTLMACAGLNVRNVICERTDPRHYDIGRVWSSLRRLTYPRCGALVVQTQGVASWARGIVGGRPVFVVPNPVLDPSLPAATDEQREPIILCMGRLDPVKAFDCAIEGFGLIAEHHPDWKLRILGEGPERPALEAQIADLNLSQQVDLPGWVNDPVDELLGGRIFLLTSRWEGFPNAILEAMACGLPTVSFDIESGPSEIIRVGTDGFLIEPGRVDMLATAMQLLMSDDELRCELAASAPDVVQRFGREEFFRQWDAILDKGKETTNN